MAEYIDKDELLKDLKDKCDYALREYYWSGEYIMGFTHATDIVNKALPLNVAIVKHGQWIESKEHLYLQNGCKEWTNFYCSECDALNNSPTNYCPNCGAKMDGDN